MRSPCQFARCGLARGFFIRQLGDTRVTDVNYMDALAGPSEEAIARMLKRSGFRVVVKPYGKYGTDLIAMRDGLVVTCGVEQIKRWEKHGKYQYEEYNLNTHKRARKMVSREEELLFVVNLDLTEFIFITPSDISNSDALGYSRQWGVFEDRDYKVGVHVCPWGQPSNEEYSFRIKVREPTGVGDKFPLTTLELRKRLRWTGPLPVIEGEIYSKNSHRPWENK